MNEVLYAIGAMLAIALVLDVIARAAPAAMAQMPRVRAARQRLQDVQLKGKRSLDEMAALKNRRDALLDDMMLIDARLRDAKRRTAAFAAGRLILVHELGKNAPDRKMFEAYVQNPAVNNPNRPIMAERVNPIYGTPQLVEIWAENLVEARETLDKQYPREEGFEVEFVGQTIEAVMARPKP